MTARRLAVLGLRGFGAGTLAAVLAVLLFGVRDFTLGFLIGMVSGAPATFINIWREEERDARSV